RCRLQRRGRAGRGARERRRGSGWRRVRPSESENGAGELRERLREGVDRVGELLALRVGELIVGREARLDRAVLREHALEGVELRLDLLRQFRALIALCRELLHVAEGDG